MAVADFRRTIAQMLGVDPRSRRACALLVAAAPLLVGLGCRDRANAVRPLPDAERVVSVPVREPPKDSRVEGTVTRYLATGWAHVLDVDLTGDVEGDGQLYVPVGVAAERMLIPSAASSGSKLELRLEPMAHDAGAGGPYELHVEQRADGGRRYWRVLGIVIAGR